MYGSIIGIDKVKGKKRKQKWKNYCIAIRSFCKRSIY